MEEFDIYIRVTGTRGGGEGKTTVASAIISQLIKDGYAVFTRNELPDWAISRGGDASEEIRFHRCSGHPGSGQRRAFVTTSLNRPDERDLLEAGVVDDD